MTVPFDTVPLPNQSGDHTLVFNDPELNSSSRTKLVGTSRLDGSLMVGRFPMTAAWSWSSWVRWSVVVGGDVVVVVGGEVAGIVVGGLRGSLPPRHCRY